MAPRPLLLVRHSGPIYGYLEEVDHATIEDYGSVLEVCPRDIRQEYPTIVQITFFV